MRDDIAISVRDVAKRFRLYRSPWHRLLDALPWTSRQRHAEFWALRGVSFDVPQGTTLGILGRNGSGKSTLLQILYSVLQPTTGAVSCRGKMSALLELGAGFNPAFTGRANIFLHGATLGLSQRQIQQRLPAIVDFAEIGPFLDQPVKSYSSGMFVRLAFAAAISDDPDILIVDEALAVGDAKFQQKCYHKFLEFQQAGKTILLVTHDTQAVIKHCDQALLLEHGRLVTAGAPNDVVNRYYELLFTGQASNGAAQPVQVRQGYKGFNIVHYGQTHYALAESAGPVDLQQLTKDELAALERRHLCARADSLQEVQVLVDRITLPAAPLHLAGARAERLTPSPREEFFASRPDSDQCPRRPGYNPNEHRFGDRRRGAIVDFLVISGDDDNAVSITSGTTIDIYLKARFHDDLELPLVGLAVKTIDGLVLYGTSTRLQQVALAPAAAGDVRVYHFSLRLPLPPGDVFVDLGLAEKLPAEDNPVDIRYDLIHLRVHQKEQFSGLVNLEATLREVTRMSSESRSRECASGSQGTPDLVA
jgi:lipopolysaccharide transport system ATP-binding protein